MWLIMTPAISCITIKQSGCCGHLSLNPLQVPDVSANTQMVLSSTGFNSLASNGTNNPWALYGLSALHAALQLQVRKSGTQNEC